MAISTKKKGACHSKGNDPSLATRHTRDMYYMELVYYAKARGFSLKDISSAIDTLSSK